MQRIIRNFFSLLMAYLCLLVSMTSPLQAAPLKSKSFYPGRLDDPEAVYFTSDNFHITGDGKTDVSNALQEAINTVKTDHNFGIFFIPEGTYLISKTIYIPQAVRLIGYGKERPVFVLAKNSPGYQAMAVSDKTPPKYMFWFVSRLPQDGQPIQDAGAGTFYSAMSNIDLIIDEGNPAAVALRTHYAQHSFISHVDIHIGKGKAGIHDVGNEIEDVHFFEGEYGIYTTKPSPGWPFMMVDCQFEEQRKAAIKTQEAGLTIVRMSARNVPTVIDMDPDFSEKLFMEDCQFENISGAAIMISNENNANTQINLCHIDCRNVPILAGYRRSGKQTQGRGGLYKVNRFVYGLQIDSLDAEPEFKSTQDIERLKSFPTPVLSDIPQFPAISTWVNLKSLGAKGDGETDDTQAVQAAIDKYPTIYIPQGWYRVTQTLKLRLDSVLIGLNPIATQLVLPDNAGAFGGFGGPKALLETSVGGSNIVSGIGLSTGSFNSRAVACKWMAGAHSYMNDVKFVGGHGGMARGPQPKGRPNYYGGQGDDPAWDTQYWSLWITNGGGGTFKDIWSASTFAASGVYVSDTATEGRIYAMSVEHHVRNEVRFKNVANWKVYALQLEEESREGWHCQPMELEDSRKMVFANLYMFRVIRIINPYPYSIRSWDCSDVELFNVHNYSQIKYTTNLPLYDVNTDREVRPWEFARLHLAEAAPRRIFPEETSGTVRLLAKGFEFAEGICRDGKGNIYFSESRWKRIYKWSVETNSLRLIADFPWEPLSLACDRNDQLLVVFKYVPRPGYLVNGKQEAFTNPEDAAGTSFSGWGNSGFGVFVYSIDPNRPEETIRLLDKVSMGSIKNIHKALYPANRWRDYHDFDTITTNRAKESWIAPDGVTIVPVCYDLARSSSLVEAFPGKLLYATDEYIKRTVQLDVSAEGYLSNLKYFVEKGEFSSAVDHAGNVYVADGEIYVFDKTGKQIDEIHTPERPATLAFGGKDGNTLFITARSSLYSVRPRQRP